MVDYSRHNRWKTVDDSPDFEGSVKEIITYLTGFVMRYGDNVNIYRHYSSDGVVYTIRVKYIETDEEWNKRIAFEERNEASRMKKEREEYERLKTKFG